MMLDIVFYIVCGFEQFLLKSNVLAVLFVMVLLLPYGFKDWARFLSLFAIVVMGFLFNASISFFGVISISSKAFQWAYWCLLLLLFLFCLYRLISSGRKLRNKSDTIFYVIAFLFGFMDSMVHEGIWRPVVSKASFEFIALIAYGIGYFGGLIMVAIVYFLAAYVLQNLLRFTQREWGLIVCSIAIGILTADLIKII